jgi:hypothetical protein
MLSDVFIGKLSLFLCAHFWGIFSRIGSLFFCENPIPVIPKGLRKTISGRIAFSCAHLVRSWLNLVVGLWKAILTEAQPLSRPLA